MFTETSLCYFKLFVLTNTFLYKRSPSLQLNLIFKSVDWQVYVNYYNNDDAMKNYLLLNKKKT